MNVKHITSFVAITLASVALSSPAWSQLELKSEDSWARKIMHYDDDNEDLEGITVAKKNPVDDTLEELTYNQHEIIVTRRMFQMDSKGRIRNGLIFDGKKNLLGRTEYGFDKWDRIQQERLYTKKGKLVRALLYRYDTSGSPIKPIAYTFDPSNPSSKKRVTTDVEPILPASRNESDYPGIKINTTETSNRAPTNNPFKGINMENGANSKSLTQGGQDAGQGNQAKPKKKKKGWLKRLFGGED
ncbi:MAG: hypothetical protein ACI9R3_000188 [Verrucomicrobiales bacterium]|jgi:hypothetical protein